MEMTNWKTLFKKESYGEKSFGIEIRVALDRELNENDRRASYKLADDVEDAVMRETMRLNSDQILNKATEKIELLDCFAGRSIFMEEIPNGYCSRWCCDMRPWYKATTSKGVITIGWRKHVINLSWTPTVGGKAEVEFPDEKVTTFDYTIHAHGYDKAAQYIDHLLR